MLHFYTKKLAMEMKYNTQILDPWGRTAT